MAVLSQEDGRRSALRLAWVCFCLSVVCVVGAALAIAAVSDSYGALIIVFVAAPAVIFVGVLDIVLVGLLVSKIFRYKLRTRSIDILMGISLILLVGSFIGAFFAIGKIGG